MPIELRSESSDDIAAIEFLTAAAFLHTQHTSHCEQFIVNALRKAGKLAISLVAEKDGALVGHVACSPVTISDGRRGWYGLGPIAAAPACQNRGIGSRLMAQSIAELQKLGAAGCVLLGDPAFYGRFGFTAQPALILADVPPEYFLVLLFRGDIPVGAVSYHESFNALS